MALSDIWESINDKCWPIVEGVKLGDVFDEYSIPPVILPLAILLLVLVLLFVFMSGGPPATVEAVCGDGACLSGEDNENCPEDCPRPEPEGFLVNVNLDKTPECQLTLTLYAQDNTNLRSLRGTEQEFSFDKIDEDAVYVKVTDSYDHEQKSATKNLDSDEETMDITLESTMCQKPTDSRGVLRLTVKDSSTNTLLNGVLVSINEVADGRVVNTETTQTINGNQDFSLNSDTYTIYAGRDGYEDAETSVAISSGQTTSKALSLTPSTSPGLEPQLGDVEICVTEGGSPVSTGVITLEGLSDGFVEYGDLSQVDPTSEPTDDGCFVFNGLPDGKILTASMSATSANCVDATTNTITVNAPYREQVNLDIDCNVSVAYLKSQDHWK